MNGDKRGWALILLGAVLMGTQVASVTASGGIFLLGLGLVSAGVARCARQEDEWATTSSRSAR